MSTKLTAPAISVAMATFNGQQYLRQQLDSLAAQTLPPSELIVCDDSSTDDTLELIEEFSRTSPFPVAVYRNPHRLGYADNFLKAARLCKGEWIAFCDQDDVWLPNKLSDAAHAITQYQNTMMILQNAFLCREDLSHDGRLFPDKILPGYHPPRSQYGFWGWPGFLQTIRADVFSQLPLKERPRGFKSVTSPVSHDSWTCMIANAMLGIVVLGGPAAMYRRHEKAATGPYGRKSFKDRVALTLPVGSDHYRFLSEVGFECATYLRSISENDGTLFTRDLDKTVDDFERLAEIQLKRSFIYSSEVAVRFRSLLEVFLLGGYFGSPMTAMGRKSFGKDLLAAFGLLNLIRKPPL